MPCRTAVAWLVVALVGVASPVLGDMWSVPSGSADLFTYSNGQDQNDVFGDPFVFGDTFFFSTQFQVNTSNGGTDEETDTVSFDAVADPGLMFTSVHVEALGSYAVSGFGSSVDLDVDVSMTENPGGGSLERSFTDSLTAVPAFPISSGSGTWNLYEMVDATIHLPMPHSDIHFELFNSVLAIAGPAGSATLDVQFESLQIGLKVIPAPASTTLGFIGLGTVAVMRRKR